MEGLNSEIILSAWQLIGIGGILGALITKLVDHFLIQDRDSKKRKREKEIESYSSLINYSRGFIGDPALSYEEAFEYQQNFIKKFYNEILPFASESVVRAADDFFDSVSISRTDKKDEKTAALLNLIEVIRKDCGLKGSRERDRKYMFYTVNEQALKKEKKK